MSEPFNSLPMATNGQTSLVLPTQTNTIQVEGFEQQQNPLNGATTQENLVQQQQAAFQTPPTNLEISYEGGGGGGGGGDIQQHGQVSNSIEQSKLQRLTNDQKRDICIFHMNNPKLRQGQLAKHFNTQQYTISRILKERNKWLNLDSAQLDINTNIIHQTIMPTNNNNNNNDLQQPSVAQTSEPIYPELEAELANWYQELKGMDAKPSDKEIREKSNSLKSQFGIDDNSVTFSNQWVEGFKKRHGFKKTYYKRSRFQFEQENDGLPIIMMEANTELPNDATNYLQPVIQAPQAISQPIQPPAQPTTTPQSTSIITNIAAPNGSNDNNGYRNIRPRIDTDPNPELINNEGSITTEAYNQQQNGVLDQTSTINQYHFNHPKIIKYGMEFLNYFEMTGGINDQEKAVMVKLINLVRMRYTIQESRYLRDYLKSQPISGGSNINPQDLEALERIFNQTEM